MWMLDQNTRAPEQRPELERCSALLSDPSRCRQELEYGRQVHLI